MRKYAVAFGLVGAMALSSAAHSAAFFIAGQWYFFSLNLVADIAKLTGKDIKIGTFVAADVKITNSQTECANPTGHAVMPGEGPKGGIAHTTSPNLSDDDLIKKDRVHGNIYQTEATLADLVNEAERQNPPRELCKFTGGTQWLPVFWQDRNCDKKKPAADLQFPICYKEFAAFQKGVLTYITGPNKGQWVGNDTDPLSWTFVYLPTAFKFTAFLDTDTSTGYGNIFGKCSFPPNNEPGAALPGQPYSLANPPVNGWAALIPTSNPAGFTNLFFQCVPITAAEYAAP